MEKFYIVALIGLVTLIILLLYFKTSNKKTKKVLTTNFKQFNADNFAEIDFAESNISFHTSRDGNEKIKISLQLFEEKVFKNNLNKWQDWLLMIKEGKVEQDESLSVFVNDFLDYKNSLLKITVLKIKEEKVFLRLCVTPQEKLSRLKFDNILENKNFQKKLQKTLKDEVSVALFSLNFNSFDNLLNRYGSKIITPYMNKVNAIVSEYQNSNLVKGIYQKDVFLFYKTLPIDGLTLEQYLEKVSDFFHDKIHFEDLALDLEPFISVIVIGSRYININNTIQTVVNLSEEAIRNHKKICFGSEDGELDSKNRKKVLSVLRHKNYEIDFYPIVSLHSGRIVANLLEVDYRGLDIKNFEDLLKAAKANQLQNELYVNILKSSLIKYQDNENKPTLYIHADYKILEVFEKVYFSTPGFDKIRVGIIISDYEDLNVSRKILPIFKRLKEKGITFGVVANARMQTTLYDILRDFSFIVIPTEMIVSDDERSAVMVREIISNTEILNLQTMVFKVSNYITAERVKGFGIDFINGPLFDERNDDIISVRRISKLIDNVSDLPYSYRR